MLFYYIILSPCTVLARIYCEKDLVYPFLTCPHCPPFVLLSHFLLPFLLLFLHLFQNELMDPHCILWNIICWSHFPCVVTFLRSRLWKPLHTGSRCFCSISVTLQSLYCFGTRCSSLVLSATLSMDQPFLQVVPSLSIGEQYLPKKDSNARYVPWYMVLYFVSRPSQKGKLVHAYPCTCTNINIHKLISLCNPDTHLSPYETLNLSFPENQLQGL